MAKRRTININSIRMRDHRNLRRFESKYIKLVYEALQESVKPVLNDINAEIDPLPIERLYFTLYDDVGLYFAKSMYDQIEKLETKAAPSFFLDTWRVWMREFANKYIAKKVVEINNTTREKIAKAIADAYEDGISTRSGIAKLIEERTLGAIGRRRAKTIARTETSAAANEGKDRSANDWARETGTGLYKIWLAGGSRNHRPSHKALDNNKAIPRDSKWNVDGEMMDRPHDPSAGPGNVVNCNCTVVYVSERYAKRINNS